MTPFAKHVAATVGCVVLPFVAASCTVSVEGSASQASASSSVSAPQSDGGSTVDPQQLLDEQCAAGVAAAEGFLPSWKALATNGSIPTAEQRTALATEIQGYADQITAQLPAIADPTLVTRLQAVVFEMDTLVQGLGQGIEVRLDAYTVAMDAVKAYCGL